MSDMTGLFNKQLKAELDKYKRQYRNLVARCQQLEEMNKAAEFQMEIMRQNLVNAQKAIDMNKIMLRQAIEEHNRKERELIEFMNKLKTELRKLGYVDFNKLGN